MADNIDEALDEQLRYYRARAPEYDQWWYREGRYDRPNKAAWVAEVADVSAALDRFNPGGRVLEVACGTGIWTERLARYARSVTALDASPEVLALNAQRVRPSIVQYVQADIFAWEPAEPFDVVFFGFWLTHVPPERFKEFWELVGRCLKPDGRVFFVDSKREPTSTASDHALPAVSSPFARRKLNDGREFRIYKVFYDPAELTERLRAFGWEFEVTETARFFIVGAGRRAPVHRALAI